ncbi:hypothetical protein [Elstera cyanobacteriorum]|uniref:hypothetical protein n=1 Tax=Elstera cyanobacteriorum TaxID=2022747 RepID=UPI0023541C4C|nr:hypothetical protein [Elstera cyanobacteriorum]MCK6441787.1 hypothetical protein [Elstera cyanobacteriorum]
MTARPSQALAALLLILALLGNLAASFSVAPPAQRAFDAAQTELTALLGAQVAFCTPAMTGEGPTGPAHHGTAECILCCLPSPLRLALLAQASVLWAPPKPGAVQAPWPLLPAAWHEADPPPAPYRPRDPPPFG